MAKYLVTGGAGFIGGHLAEALARRGDSVRILDNFSTGKRENISQLGKSLEVINADVCDRDAVAKAVRGVDGVFHQAAMASVPRSVREPLLTNQSNIDGTLNILMAARENGARRVVMASSSSVYGNSPTLPKIETMPIDPLSPYAIQKAAGELYVRSFYPLYGLETVALRYFNIFGPRQDPQSEYAAVIPRFVTRMLNGEAPTIYGDGEQSRDFTYVENAVAANIAAMEASVSACGKAYNIGCGERFTLNELVANINEILGKKLTPKYEADRAGDVKHSLADISAAKENIGYRPSISFKDGLRRTVEWFQSVKA